MSSSMLAWQKSCQRCTEIVNRGAGIIREQAAHQMAELIVCEEKGQESFKSKSFELDNCWISRTLVRFRKLACAIDHGFLDFSNNWTQ